MLKVGKYDILKVSKRIETKAIKIGSDTDLYITPKRKMIVQSQQAEYELASKFLVFIEKENEYGFGIYVNNNDVQLGYGTKENFQNHNLEQGLTITPDQIIGPPIEGSTKAIPISEVEEMVDAIL